MSRDRRTGPPRPAYRRRLELWRNSTSTVASVAIAAASVACWILVYGGGGSRSALPHLFYVPILLAAARFGRAGGLVAGVVATVLCGPLMPLVVDTAAAQPWANWVGRGLFFVVVGGLAGATLQAVDRTYGDRLAERLDREMERPDRAPFADLEERRSRIEAIIEDRTFAVVFQPIYSLRDGRLVAVEALTRFAGDAGVPPNVRFDEAARVGLGTELELAAILAAFEASDTIPAEVALSINCSPATLADPRFVHFIQQQRPRPVIVEITEHAFIDDYGLLDGAIHALRAWGARVAIDDAGAGFASLRHIVRLAPEIIKLDISLTQNLRDDPVRRALADSLIRFARETGSQVIAEGIEQPSDLATWVDLGADAAQGFHLARPGALPAPARCRHLRALRVG